MGISLSFQPAGVRAKTKTAGPSCVRPATRAESVTSAATRFGSSCSVRTTRVCHASGGMPESPFEKPDS